ncbi:MAG: hypothetical protein ACKVIH_13285 [Burkholderiales bacterium]
MVAPAPVPLGLLATLLNTKSAVALPATVVVPMLLVGVGSAVVLVMVAVP